MSRVGTLLLTAGDEGWVVEVGLVVGEGAFCVGVDDFGACGVEEGVAGGGVPLHGWPETYIQISFT